MKEFRTESHICYSNNIAVTPLYSTILSIGFKILSAAYHDKIEGILSLFEN